MGTSWKPLTAALRTIYTAPSTNRAADALDLCERRVIIVAARLDA